MKKTISTIFALITAAMLTGCGSNNSGESLDLNYEIENLDLSNTKIIENTPENGKWRKITFDFQVLSKQSADKIIKFAENYGISNLDKNDFEMRLYSDIGNTAKFPDYDKYLSDDPEDFPYQDMLYRSDEFYIEVQGPTGGMVELDNRKNINSVLGMDYKSGGSWRPSFFSTQAAVDLNDEAATCILNGKTVKIADAIKNAEKYVYENDILFPKSFGAKVFDAVLYTYENGYQSLFLEFGYTIDGVPLEYSPSDSIDDENGVSYKTYRNAVKCAMLTENTLDWIWFPAIDGGAEFISEDCEISISREKACELVSKKLTQDRKVTVKEIQLMYVAERAESGKYFWEPSKSIIEPVWRFHVTGVLSQEYSSLYVYVSAINGEIQISRVMR